MRDGFVTVYHYQYWDESQQAMLTSPGKATLECIRCGLGTPLIASGGQVPMRDLDAFGRVIS